jgi:hypothetical protein
VQRGAAAKPARVEAKATQPRDGKTRSSTSMLASAAAASRGNRSQKGKVESGRTAKGTSEQSGKPAVVRPKLAVARPPLARVGTRPKSASRKPASGARRGAARGKAPKGAALRKGANKNRIGAAQLPVARVVKIKALDPYAMCGPRTSVVHLLRVDERQQDGVSAVHLVFFDRHGWYCEHGPACRAVEDVRKQGKQLGLTI